MKGVARVADFCFLRVVVGGHGWPAARHNDSVELSVFRAEKRVTLGDRGEEQQLQMLVVEARLTMSGRLLDIFSYLAQRRDLHKAMVGLPSESDGAHASPR